MTDKELRKLKRAELLELLYYLQKENEELRAEMQILKEQTAKPESILPENFMEQIRQMIQEALQPIQNPAEAEGMNLNEKHSGEGNTDLGAALKGNEADTLSAGFQEDSGEYGDITDHCDGSSGTDLDAVVTGIESNGFEHDAESGE